MKSKLVKYPFDEKKYRWDTHKMGKTFEYSWDETEPGDYTEINPYIEGELYRFNTNKRYIILDGSNIPPFDIEENVSASVNTSVEQIEKESYEGANLNPYIPSYGTDGWAYYYHIQPSDTTSGLFCLKYQDGHEFTVLQRGVTYYDTNDETVHDVKYGANETIQLPSTATNIHYFAKASGTGNVSTVFMLPNKNNTVYDKYRTYAIIQGSNFRDYGLSSKDFEYLLENNPSVDYVLKCDKNKNLQTQLYNNLPEINGKKYVVLQPTENSIDDITLYHEVQNDMYIVGILGQQYFTLLPQSYGAVRNHYPVNWNNGCLNTAYENQ